VSAGCGQDRYGPSGAPPSVAPSSSDIAAVVHAAAGRPVKMILECGLLSDAQKRRGAEIVAKAGAAFVKTSTGFLGSGAAFVKTSTGFLGSGATLHDVTLLHEVVGSRLSVKATGGIRFFEDAVALLDAGASRLGASRTEAVLASRGDRSNVIPPARS
jgi:deoxyribose-phosphate aldolase